MQSQRDIGEPYANMSDSPDTSAVASQGLERPFSTEEYRAVAKGECRERALLVMVLEAARGDWDQTIPTLEHYADIRLREIADA
jgi:hypothetical protein